MTIRAHLAWLLFLLFLLLLLPGEELLEEAALIFVWKLIFFKAPLIPEVLLEEVTLDQLPLNSLLTI